MDKIEKQLNKLSQKELLIIKGLIEQILNREFTGLNLKKLKGLKNFFRIRKGSIRIIFELEAGKEPIIFSIERRKEDTYKI